jgi:hypothetical protein
VTTIGLPEWTEQAAKCGKMVAWRRVPRNTVTCRDAPESTLNHYLKIAFPTMVAMIDHAVRINRVLLAAGGVATVRLRDLAARAMQDGRVICRMCRQPERLSSG